MQQTSKPRVRIAVLEDRAHPTWIRAIKHASQSVSIRPLDEGDLPEAGAILRRAFATQFGMPPDTFWMDRDLVTGRWVTNASLAFGAWIEDRLVGSSLATSWGSLGVFRTSLDPPRHLESRDREAPHSSGARAVECIGNSAPGLVHVSRKYETHCLVSEVWLLAAIPHRNHDPSSRSQ
jgi:hypothetical protein